jgi:hypothetical protein
MPIAVIPRDEFKELDEAAVVDALADPDGANPIAQEVARLIEGYTANFADYCRRVGGIPRDILRVTPGTAIEAVAMKLTTEAIRAELGTP